MTKLRAPELVSVLTPQEYNRLVKSVAGDVERVEIRPPVVGKPGFGSLIVTWKFPVIRPNGKPDRAR